MEYLIQHIIDTEVKRIGVSDYEICESELSVTSANCTISLKNDVYILIDKTLDIPITARLTLVSQHDMMATSKVPYEATGGILKVFRNELTVITENYQPFGSFKPFNIKCIKITPMQKSTRMIVAE